jgi:hypothetical protein
MKPFAVYGQAPAALTAGAVFSGHQAAMNSFQRRTM